MNQNTETALMLLKLSLGITHDKRDILFRSMLSASASELRGRGVQLDLDNIDDTMLLADYCEFNYRNRDGNKAMPRNLDIRIRNKIVKGRAEHGT